MFRSINCQNTEKWQIGQLGKEWTAVHLPRGGLVSSLWVNGLKRAVKWQILSLQLSGMVYLCSGIVFIKQNAHNALQKYYPKQFRGQGVKNALSLCYFAP